MIKQIKSSYSEPHIEVSILGPLYVSLKSRINQRVTEKKSDQTANRGKKRKGRIKVSEPERVRDRKKEQRKK